MSGGQGSPQRPTGPTVVKVIHSGQSTGAKGPVRVVQIVSQSHPSAGGGGTHRTSQQFQSYAASTGRLPVDSKAPTLTPATGGGGGRPLGLGAQSANPTALSRPLRYDFSFNTMRRFPRTTDRSKGLRHFSTKVCEKVKEKGQTTYNEVADELVQEYFDSLTQPPGDHEKQQYDMKNIRRRVYDALNVLMAMNIIEKEKKEIRWVGLPTSSVQECRRLEDEKVRRHERIRHKAEQLQELIIQLVAYKSLVERNRENERVEGRPPQNTLLYLPYIVVNTDRKTMIDCSIAHDKTEYLFNFDQPFEIHDDIEVLKRLDLAHGLERAQVAPEQLQKVREYLPPALREYVDQIVEGRLAGGLVGPSMKSAPAQLAYTLTPDRSDTLGVKIGGVQSIYGRRSGYEMAAAAASSTPVRYAVVPRTTPTLHQIDARRAAGGGGQQQVAYLVGSGLGRHVVSGGALGGGGGGGVVGGGVRAPLGYPHPSHYVVEEDGQEYYMDAEEEEELIEDPDAY